MIHDHAEALTEEAERGHHSPATVKLLLYSAEYIRRLRQQKEDAERELRELREKLQG